MTAQQLTTPDAGIAEHRALRSVCRAAFVWVVVFAGFHVYWFCGGTFGFGDASTTVPEVDSVGAWVFSAVVGVMFLVGGALPHALHRPWGRIVPRWILHTCAWTGAVLLVVRGASGVLDTLVRSTGLLPNGLTGLTEQQVSGEAHPTAYTQWSSTSIDLYFLLGGVLFLIAALRYRRLSAARRDRDGA